MNQIKDKLMTLRITFETTEGNPSKSTQRPATNKKREKRKAFGTLLWLQHLLRSICYSIYFFFPIIPFCFLLIRFCTHAYLMPRLNEQMWLRSQMKCFIFCLCTAYDCLTTTKMMMMMILMYIDIEWENDWKFIEWFHVFLISPLYFFALLVIIIIIFEDNKAWNGLSMIFVYT